MKKLLSTLVLLLSLSCAWSQCTPPSIYSQPTSYSGVCDGVDFICFANGDNLVYQWQMDDGSGFVNLSNTPPFSGTDGSILDISPAPYSLNGNQFRCVVNGSCGIEISTTVSIGIVPPIIITGNTSPQTTCEGNAAVFSVQSSGSTGQGWEIASNPLGPWTVLTNGGVYSGASTSTLTITGTTVSMNGNYYRCLLNNDCSPFGDTYSDVALLTVNAPGTCNPLNVWLGNSPGWLTASNWSLGTPPTGSCAYDVLIPSTPAGGIFPIIGPAVSPYVSNLTIQNGATLTIGLALNICGDLHAGVNSYASIQGNGKVIFVGSTEQNIFGKCKFKKVTSNNSSANGINVNGNIEISNAWVMQDGDINVNGSFTLKSNSSGNAFLDFFTYPVGGFFNGPLTVEQYVANTADGYRDISLPVTAQVSQLANDFSVVGQNGVNCWYSYSPYPTLQEYREFENTQTTNYYGGFWSFTSPAAYFEAARGYAARIYNAPMTLSATGNVNYGTQLIQVTNTPSATTTADGWNLIGNPYPSPIKWSSVKALNAGKTSGSCYRFSTTGEYAGTWSAHNGVTGVPSGTTDEISTFQGFFVLAPATDFMFFENTVCTGGNTVAFYKTDALDNELRLKITNGINADEIVTYTDANATTNNDLGYDAVKIPTGGQVQMSFSLNGEEFAINVLNEITAQTELPLTISVTDNGNYTISALSLNLTSLTAYLKDAGTNTLYDLSTTSPSFSVNAGQNYSGRFSVVFTQNGTTSVQEKTESAATIYAMGNEIFVKRNAATPAHLIVANILGQQIVDEISSTENTTIYLPKCSDGYVFVKLTEGNNVTVSKVLITNKK